MSVRRGMVGFGVSASFALGTAYAAHEYVVADNFAQVTYDCGYAPHYTGKNVCKDVDYSNSAISETQAVQNVYYGVAKAGAYIAGITAFISYADIMLGNNDFGRREQIHKLDVHTSRGTVEGPPPPVNPDDLSNGSVETPTFQVDPSDLTDSSADIAVPPVALTDLTEI
jgi:hypothetical protein